MTGEGRAALVAHLHLVAASRQARRVVAVGVGRMVMRLPGEGQVIADQETMTA